MLFEEAQEAIERGLFIDDEGNEKEFKWNTRENIEGAIEDQTVWGIHITNRQDEIMDEVAHFSLKQDLVQHAWASYGMA